MFTSLCTFPLFLVCGPWLSDLLARSDRSGDGVSVDTIAIAVIKFRALLLEPRRVQRSTFDYNVGTKALCTSRCQYDHHSQT